MPQPPTEWTVTYRLAGKTRKILYRTTNLLAYGLQDMTRGGWSAVVVTERVCANYVDPDLGW
jgi:hypothetical protein